MELTFLLDETDNKLYIIAVSKYRLGKVTNQETFITSKHIEANFKFNYIADWASSNLTIHMK